RSFAKVRVLLAEPMRVMRDSNRFVAMGRRLSSCIDIRYVAAQAPQRASTYLIADDRAIVYRMRADTWDGVADINNPTAARLYLRVLAGVGNPRAADPALPPACRGCPDPPRAARRREQPRACPALPTPPPPPSPSPPAAF